MGKSEIGNGNGKLNGFSEQEKALQSNGEPCNGELSGNFFSIWIKMWQQSKGEKKVKLLGRILCSYNKPFVRYTIVKF